MNKYKYQIYDYSKVGIEKKKFFVRKELTSQEWEAIKTIAYTQRDAALALHRELKKAYCDAKPNYKYDPNIDWDWEIVTPEKIYYFK